MKNFCLLYCIIHQGNNQILDSIFSAFGRVLSDYVHHQHELKFEFNLHLGPERHYCCFLQEPQMILDDG
ncbi:hypothetical protein L6452_22297 [Arctium lappa]|uniref:Uncharacterized protein n=1 Tax=Arctium lappa TaxID=4217 RepID=A0ACB9AZR9_ARCLA|nr:hypothetical protein L6452_22297 [Arctium lappa]